MHLLFAINIFMQLSYGRTKKLSRINDNSNPNKIKKTLTKKFNVSIDTTPDIYQNKVKTLPKLKLHNISNKKKKNHAI